LHAHATSWLLTGSGGSNLSQGSSKHGVRLTGLLQERCGSGTLLIQKLLQRRVAIRYHRPTCAFLRWVNVLLRSFNEAFVNGEAVANRALPRRLGLVSVKGVLVFDALIDLSHHHTSIRTLSHCLCNQHLERLAGPLHRF